MSNPLEPRPEDSADVTHFNLTSLSNGHIRLDVVIPDMELERLTLDMSRPDAIDLMILLGAALQAGRDLALPGNPQKA